MRQLMGINGEKFLFVEHELFAKCSELMRQCGTVTCPLSPVPCPLSLRRHPRRVRLRRCGSCRHLRGRTAFQADIEGRTRYDGVS